MRMSWKSMVVAGVMGVGLLALGVTSADAGCGGGRGRASRVGYGGGSCCNMGGMPMGGMAMPPMQAQGASMQGMNMGGYAPAPAAPASGQYHCEMHPNVVSATPATCPICKMALTK